MNGKELVLSALNGKGTEVLPFIPRLDIWYKANKRNGTLPERFRNASLRDITDELGIGYHAVVPDFRDNLFEDDDIDIGLGIYRFRAIPYDVRLNNIKKTVDRDNGLTTVQYSTPYGTITTKVLYDDTMKKSGATLAHVVEYALKGVDDFKALAYIFENAEVLPKYNGLEELKNYLGERGPIVAFNSLGASPMHYIMKELISTETFFYESFDHPDELHELKESISGYFYRMYDLVVKSPADIILSGANYDSSITTPAFFSRYITPELKKQAIKAHTNGKYLLTHTDGENRGLLNTYLDAGFDIADSICPDPMTSLSLKEIKDKFGEKITIWGGIPSVSVLENSMSEYQFEALLNSTFESIGRGDHIIFSIADTTPPDAKFERILKIIKKTEEFGPVK